MWCWENEGKMFFSRDDVSLVNLEKLLLMGINTSTIEDVAMGRIDIQVLVLFRLACTDLNQSHCAIAWPTIFFVKDVATFVSSSLFEDLAE